MLTPSVPVPGLRQFLIEAKTRTYASGEGALMLPDGTKELSYVVGPWHYRDRYAGFDPFSGQEIVWHERRAVWTMGYYGATLSGDNVDPSRIYTFLQTALSQVTTERPFRGPSSYREGDLEYRDVSHGDLARFSGVETIFERGREVYRLEYYGGTVA